MAFNITPQSILQDAILGINLLQSNLNADTVGIFDGETFQQIYSDARPIKAEVYESSKIMKYPVETGVTLSDFKVTNPTSIEMVFIANSVAWQTAYQQMRNDWINATLISAQTKTGVYRNMVIAAMPHTEEASMFDAVVIYLKLEEAIMVAPNSIASQNQPANYSPANPAFGNTIPRGFQSFGLPLALSAASYVRAISVWGF